MNDCGKLHFYLLLDMRLLDSQSPNLRLFIHALGRRIYSVRSDVFAIFCVLTVGGKDAYFQLA